jgi:hypothetical protein
MQVDAVQQRSADPAEVALDDRAGAAALARGVAIVAAGAPLRCLFAICTFELPSHKAPPTLSN